jgi:tripartite-type tricarboxylate transporter receptor subunit TctC
MKFSFRAALVSTLLAAGACAHADTWPSKPIHFVVPFGPGGANDLVARYVAEAASRELGQPIIVDNKPGAGSVLGADIVAKALGDRRAGRLAHQGPEGPGRQLQERRGPELLHGRNG